MHQNFALLVIPLPENCPTAPVEIRTLRAITDGEPVNCKQTEEFIWTWCHSVGRLNGSVTSDEH